MLIKYSGKYVKIYFNMKITFLNFIIFILKFRETVQITTKTVFSLSLSSSCTPFYSQHVASVGLSAKPDHPLVCYPASAGLR